MKLDAVRRFALALPGTVEAPHFDYTSFRVNGRIIATAPPDGLHVHVFLDEEQRETALAVEPALAEKLLWGGKTVGVRVRLADARPRFVEGLLRQAWTRRATASPAPRKRTAPAATERPPRPRSGTGKAARGPKPGGRR